VRRAPLAFSARSRSDQQPQSAGAQGRHPHDTAASAIAHVLSRPAPGCGAAGRAASAGGRTRDTRSGTHGEGAKRSLARGATALACGQPFGNAASNTVQRPRCARATCLLRWNGLARSWRASPHCARPQLSRRNGAPSAAASCRRSAQPGALPATPNEPGLCHAASLARERETKGTVAARASVVCVVGGLHSRLAASPLARCWPWRSPLQSRPPSSGRPAAGRPRSRPAARPAATQPPKSRGS